MNHVIIPYGAEGQEYKTRFFEELIASRPGPPFLYNDIMILVPSSRLKRTYGRLFLEIVERTQGAPVLVPPQISTLHQFFHTLSAIHGGPTLIDEYSRLVLLEGIVKKQMAKTAGFGNKAAVLAPSLSAAVANIIEELSAAGVTPDRFSSVVAESEFSDKPPVRMLTEVYRQYELTLTEKGRIDPAGIPAFLEERFDPAWLSAYSNIIIDGIHDTDPCQTRVLRMIAAATKGALLITAPSMESITQAGDYHPLKLTKEFLADLGVSHVDEPASLDPDDRFLAGLLFSDQPFAEAAKEVPPPSSFNKDIRLFSAVNTREEVSLIAGKVKQSLRNGIMPDSILVAFPSIDEYGPLAEEIFRDYGIPYNRALGRQLSTSPVTTALISLLYACQEDYSAPSLIRICTSPFLKFSDNPAVAPALDRLMRRKRIMGGRDRLLSALRSRSAYDQENNLLQEPLNDLFSALKPFTSPGQASLALWMERLTNLIAWSGISSRVSLIKGPLNINLQAFRKLSETLASLSAAGRLVPEYAYTFHEWFFLLKKTCMHTRFQVPPEDEGGVQVLGLGESMGRAWSEIYLGGLKDGAFPQRLPQNIFLPEATLESLGVHTLEKARMNAAHHFYRVLLSAPKVTLTWPENEGDRPVVPSPFLAELAPLRLAGLINGGIEKTTGIQFSLRIEESMSIPELAKAISVAGNPEGLQSGLLDTDVEGMSGIRSALAYQPAEPAPSIIPPSGRKFRITELDAYLACPYDYFVTYVLNIAPLEEATEDISPLERGSKVHAILRNFYDTWDSPVTQENRNEARALLEKLADAAFATEADTFRNRREKERFLTIMAERFLDAEETFWKQGMRPAYLEQTIDLFKLRLADGTEAELRAKIDRIDVDEDGNFIIVDYKTGGYPQPKMSIEQDIFQLPVYAVMAGGAYGNTPTQGKSPPLKKPIGLAYYDLSGKHKGPARDVVLYNKDSGIDQPAAKPKASPKSAEDFDTILKQSMEKARRAVEGILAGDFIAAPRDANKCRYCANEIMCGKRSKE